MDAKEDIDVEEFNPSYQALIAYLAYTPKHSMKHAFKHAFKQFEVGKNCDGLEKDQTEAMKKLMREWMVEMRKEMEESINYLLIESGIHNTLKGVAAIKPCKDHRVPTGNPQIDSRHFIGVAMHGGMQNLKKLLQKEAERQKPQEIELKQIEDEVSKLKIKISKEMELMAQMRRNTEEMNANAASLH